MTVARPKGKLFRIPSLGFTFIELMISLTIIGLLASFSLTNYITTQKHARDTRRKSDLNQYRNALEAYAAVNNGFYPIYVAPAAPIQITEGATLCSDLDNFLVSCPLDPKNVDPYFYYYLSNDDGSDYTLYVQMEIGNFWAVCGNGLTVELTGVPDPVCDLAT